MRRGRGILVALIALLPACSDGAGDRASPATRPTVPTSSTPTSSSSSTTVAPATTVSTRPATTVPPASPEGRARALYDAWLAGDRAAAGRVAAAEAVSTLFARPWQAGDGWAFSECSGAAGSVICSWQRPGGQQVLFRVQQAAGGQPVTVAEVRFQP